MAASHASTVTVKNYSNFLDWRSFVSQSQNQQALGLVEKDCLTKKAAALKTIDEWSRKVEEVNRELEKDMAREKILKERAQAKKAELERKISVLTHQ